MPPPAPVITATLPSSRPATYASVERNTFLTSE
jgi:hypothetical protein